ncbi:rhamnogalacturonan lyase family protein [Paenibacillus jiagnxiensis]|uniref:rhamnogalacturonan lyase family protein n=1 Tax=Paenibacillus jiagnxiensis TaxID=3228926 RepID=UPI0033B3E2CD
MQKRKLDIPFSSNFDASSIGEQHLYIDRKYIWKFYEKKQERMVLLKRISRVFKFVVAFVLMTTSIGLTINSAEAASGPRMMENLGRGVVAVRDGSNVFISWRLLALDPSDIGFNIYRITTDSAAAAPSSVATDVYPTEGGSSASSVVTDVYRAAALADTAVKLNSEVLTEGTNFTDTTADLTKDNTYYVKPVISDKEQAASASYTLVANSANEPAFVIPIHSGSEIGNVWVGDFDGDHEYDFLLSRRATATQTLEAYKRDGTFLWSIDLGPNSTNKNNISPGSTTIDVGMWDGATVYDLDGDGKAEIVFRIANGVTFGDGTVWQTEESDDRQWLVVVDGMTGKLKAYSDIPDDYISSGPLALQLGIGYLNGTTPSIVAYMKNRNPDKSFNVMISAYHYNGNKLIMDWKWLHESFDGADGHQVRIVDLDSDGKDEIAQIGYVLNGDGTVRYSLHEDNVVHGDRFYIGKFDPDSSEFYGYGVQQDNKTGLLEYYYNATTGKMIWQHYTTPPAGDVGRGDVGDIDPRYPGYEAWSFSGIYNGPTNTQITEPDKAPWPALRIWWDGDLLSESLNDKILDKWNYNTSSVSRLETLYKHHNATTNYRKASLFYGDILGDWREEIIVAGNDYSQLVVFTTDKPTDTRLYTLAQNPAYRNSMTIKGYLQSHLTDYYLGDGMTTPPRPNIELAP